ncbi:MAG: type transporter [Phycisphaerales bacterium]|nr:type transporter [Phycisphaerales bacterium]
MNGLLHHLLLTLKLNFRSKQAIVYGYVVPVFFLFAFGSVFRSGNPPLVREMGQLLTITVLGGACFGMPTAMVAERERGVWRRYRLLPTAIGGILLSSMVARFVLVLTAAVLQVLLANWKYNTTFPTHPLQMLVAFTFVAFSFLGLGLVIAMLANTVPAVQALGQAVFLPMIMIGGVGVPLYRLPPWAQHVAGFFPGRYAVEALDACQRGPGLSAAHFGLLALTVIGLASCLAGGKLFRWDVGQKLSGPAKGWVAVALVAWAAVGVAAERTGRLKPITEGTGTALLTTLVPGPATRPDTVAIAPNPSPISAPAIAPAVAVKPGQFWDQITDAQIKGITYDDVPDDNGTVIPLAADLNRLDDEGKKRMEVLQEALADWKPGQVADTGQRVRNLLGVCAVADVIQDPQEAEIPYIVFERLKGDIQKDQLIKAVAWVILKPGEGTVPVSIKELGVEGEVPDDTVRERVTLYGKKLLFRLLGKEPAGR